MANLQDDLEYEDKPSSISSIHSAILESPPSCIEFFPLDPLYFVIGTYTLTSEPEKGDNDPQALEDQAGKESTQSRSGSLILFHFAHGHLSQLQTQFLSSAVLDLHFSPLQQDIFAVATSTGAIRIYSLSVADEPRMQALGIIQPFSESTLVLSLAWHHSAPSILAVSLSTGEVAVLDYEKSPSLMNTIEAHSLETWTVVWSSITHANSAYTMLYSGGDDSALCAHQGMQLLDNLNVTHVPLDDDGKHLLRRDAKIHGAGVTAILPFQSTGRPAEYLITGSYDEFVRVLEPLPNQRWKVVAEKRVGGGVWRLKFMNTQPFTTTGRWQVLASCMHAGTRILEICRSSENNWSVNVLATFEEHESMNYGSDAAALADPNDSNGPALTVVSTSFYDKRLCIWRLPMNTFDN